MSHLSPFSKRSLPGAALLGLAVALTALLYLPGTGSAQTPDPLFQDFEPMGDLVLVMGGEEVPGAEIYSAERARSILVMSSRLSQPVLFNLRARRVETVPLMSLAKRGDGTVDILADAAITPLGPFTVDGSTVSFTHDGVLHELRPRPSLTGAQEADDMLEYSPEYRRLSDAYTPNAQLVSKLEGESRPVRVRLFFNSKCSVCKQMIPRAIKLDQTLKTQKIDFDYYGLPDSYSGDPIMDELDVHSVPTGIVYVDGREVGRIVGSNWKTPELALTNLLSGSGS